MVFIRAFRRLSYDLGFHHFLLHTYRSIWRVGQIRFIPLKPFSVVHTIVFFNDARVVWVPLLYIFVVSLFLVNVWWSHSRVILISVVWIELLSMISLEWVISIAYAFSYFFKAGLIHEALMLIEPLFARYILCSLCLTSFRPEIVRLLFLVISIREAFRSFHLVFLMFVYILLNFVEVISIVLSLEIILSSWHLLLLV